MLDTNTGYSQIYNVHLKELQIEFPVTTYSVCDMQKLSMLYALGNLLTRIFSSLSHVIT